MDVGLIPPGLHRRQWPPRGHTFGSAQTVCVYYESASVHWARTLRQAYPNRMLATHIKRQAIFSHIRIDIPFRTTGRRAILAKWLSIQITNRD